MSVDYLKKLNNLISDDLYPGQIIKIMDKSGVNHSSELFDSLDSLKTSPTLNNVSKEISKSVKFEPLKGMGLIRCATESDVLREENHEML